MEPELEFWKHTLVAYILGQEVPVSVMANFLRGRWKGLEIPSVIKHGKKFLLRFESAEAIDAVMQKGVQFFYSKPLILRKWEEGKEQEAEITSVPVWIQLPYLPLGFWGSNSLSRIASRVGDPLYTHELTAKKLKLEFARILVNVEVNTELPTEVMLRSGVDGKVVEQEIKYEWLPTQCKKCARWGHKAATCTRVVTQQWQIKKAVDPPILRENEQNNGTKDVGK